MPAISPSVIFQLAGAQRSSRYAFWIYLSRQDSFTSLLPQPITQARILDTAGRYLSADARGQLQHAVIDQRNLSAPEEGPSVGACARPAPEDVPTFDLGFDLAASTAANQVAGVVAGGPAFTAGLRNGQALGRVSFYNGEPDTLATITIHRDAADQSIAFYPRGKAIPAPPVTHLQRSA